jgi:hypothetical protein
MNCDGYVRSATGLFAAGLFKSTGGDSGVVNTSPVRISSQRESPFPLDHYLSWMTTNLRPQIFVPELVCATISGKRSDERLSV